MSFLRFLAFSVLFSLLIRCTTCFRVLTTSFFKRVLHFYLHNDANGQVLQRILLSVGENGRSLSYISAMRPLSPTMNSAS